MARGKMLKDESLQYQKQQYDEKNIVLNGVGEEVKAIYLYEDIFDDLDITMPIVIIDEEEEKHIAKFSIYEALEHSEGRNDMLMGGTIFFNGFVSKATAKEIRAFIIDMDNVYSNVLRRAFQHDWRLETGEEIPKPTYIVNSGTGLHLYFVLERPLPCYKSQIENIDQLYRKLAVMETTKRVYLKKSVQWFGQDFRMAGGNGKNGWKNTIFKVGDKWNADELGRAVGLKNVHFLLEGEKIQEHRNENKKYKKNTAPRKGYYINSRVYLSSLERCKNETYEGNRYLSMCALSVLAWKCNISREQLEQDLLSLIPIYNRNAERQIKNKEVYSAIKMYNPKAMITPRERTEDWLGWKFKGAKRNGRSRIEHLKRARAVQNIDYPNGEWRGRHSLQDIIYEWQKAHPYQTKAECHRDTGVSRPTIDKWWNTTGEKK